jgi:glucosamine kinase
MAERAGFVIGIDGGGSGCRAAISAADGTIVGTASAGPANVTTDPDDALRNILTALEAAADAADLPFDAVLGMPAHLGLAGIVTEEDGQRLADQLPLRLCRVSDDQLTSTIGALKDRDGALIAVGTGSFVAHKRGTVYRTLGGWGLQLGDQASGAWLGRNALQRSAMIADGLQKSSPLVERLLTRFGNDAGQMIAFAKTAAPADYAQLAPLVFDAADTDDPHAVSLIAEGATYLNNCLDSLALNEHEIICMTGGLGRLYAPWINAAHQSRLAEPLGTALDGALHLARQIVDAS